MGLKFFGSDTNKPLVCCCNDFRRLPTPDGGGQWHASPVQRPNTAGYQCMTWGLIQVPIALFVHHMSVWEFTGNIFPMIFGPFKRIHQ